MHCRLTLRWWTEASCAILVALLATSCSRSSGPPDPPLRIPSRFELVAVDDQVLPAADTAALERVLAGAIEIDRPDSLRIIHVSRNLTYERLPCSALRVMAASRGTGGIGAVTDTVTEEDNVRGGAKPDSGNTEAAMTTSEKAIHLPDAFASWPLIFANR
jgi:hypothetical protein